MTTPAPSQDRYGIEIVGVDGVVVASTTAASPSYVRYPRPPVVNTTNNRAYFEDGDTAIRWLAPDGSTGNATTVPGGPMSPVGFAVSPDDTRIAVAALQYRMDQYQTPAVQSLRLYVQALGGDKKSTDIFTSTTGVEWPIGWHKDALVIARSTAHSQYAVENPYGAYGGYRVVDPAIGMTIANVCYPDTPYDPTGPAVPAGTVCGDYLTARDWAGKVTTFAVPKGVGCLALSPGGDMATCRSWAVELGSILVYRPDGTLVSSAGSGNRPAWIDESHIAFSAGPNGYARGGYSQILDLPTGSVTSIAVPGEFVGILPGAL
jgi:hypothetical protein